MHRVTYDGGAGGVDAGADACAALVPDIRVPNAENRSQNREIRNQKYEFRIVEAGTGSIDAGADAFTALV